MFFNYYLKCAFETGDGFYLVWDIKKSDPSQKNEPI